MAKLLWKHYLFRNFTTNSLSVSRFQHESTIYFGNSLWTLSFSHFHYEFTILFAKSLLIYDLFRDISVNSLFVSLIHYEIAICFVNLLYNKNHFRGFGLNQLFFPRINSEFIIYFANSIWICSPYSEFFYELWLIHVIMTAFLRNRQKLYVTDRNHYVIISL